MCLTNNGSPSGVSTQDLTLGATLCTSCEALKFDDKDGYEVRLDSGRSILKFDEDDRERYFDLDYEWRDILPDLPGLAASAEAGCEFCGFYRASIQRPALGFLGHVIITLCYRWRDELRARKPGLVGLVAMLQFDIEASTSNSNPDESEQSWCSYLLFPIESNLGEVASWLQLEKPPMTQALCEENIAMMTYNINRCVQSCHPLRETSFIPTRLLDVGHDSSLECPRLVITQDLIPPISSQTEVVKYAALSYCWGSTVEGNSQLKTEKSSLEARMAGIPIEIMSQPVKDAMRIARALSLRYIWVDALCIVQDDHDDWDKESANMGLIYGHAYVTFCLLGSSLCCEGYLDRTISKIDIGFKSSIAPSVSGVYTINDPILFPNYISTAIDLIGLDEYNSSWPTRGWTFQEYHLSTRLLFFGRSRIHFLCENNQTSENAADDRHYNSLFSDIVMNQESGKDTTMRMYEWWREDLPPYSKRNLTIPKDKLPAISGLAKYVADATNDTYLAGLWKGDLTRELLWTASPIILGLKNRLQALSSPNTYIAPSWSWACQNNSFEYGSSRFCYSEHINLRAEYKNIQAGITLENTNPFGSIKDGYLEITGKVIPLPSNLTIVRQRTFVRQICELKVRGAHIAYCELDWTIEYPEEQPRHEMLMLLTASADLDGISDIEEESTSSDQVSSDEKGCDCMEVHLDGEGSSGEATDDESMASARSDSDISQAEDRRHAWGLILHPAKESGKYYRVGIFASQASKGPGLKLFAECEPQVICII